MPDITFLSPWAFAVGLLALLGVGVLVHSERRSRRLCAVLGLEPRPARSVAIDVARPRGRRAPARARGGAARLLAGAADLRPLRRRGDRRLRHLAVDARAAGNVGPDAPRAGARRREAHPRGPARGAGRRLVAHRPAAPAPLPDDERDRVHLDGRPLDRDRAPAARAPRRARDGVRRAGRPRPPELLRRAGAKPRRRSSSPTARASRSTWGRCGGRSSRDGSRSTSSTSGTPRSASTTSGAGRRATGRARRAAPCSTASSGRSAAASCSEQEVEGAVSAAKARLGAGPTATRGRELQAVSLAPYAAVAAVLALALVLLRRNF